MVVANVAAKEVYWEETLTELSQRWLVVEWEQWARPKQAATAALVQIGAAELRLRCLVRKEASPPPVEAIVVVSGDYWNSLRELLADVAQSVPQWRGRAGAVQIETRKIGARLTEQGERLRVNSRLELDDESSQRTTAPALVAMEACQFEDGMPLDSDLSSTSDPTCEAEVSWTLDTPAQAQGSDYRPNESSDAANSQAKSVPSKRSWKQHELDDAIAAYRDAPGNEFLSLQDMIQSGSHAAHAKARERFGRNAVVRNLGVRSPAMVTNSHVWQGIAVNLDLPRGKHMPVPLRNYERVPLDSAARAKAEGDGVVDDLVRRETPAAIDKKVREAKLKFSTGEDAAGFWERVNAIKFCVEIGRLSPDGADELVDLTIAQARDGRRRQIKQRPY
jgi:hypothetical protein